MSIPVGDMAPDFTARSDDGSTIRLTALRGSWVVLYFYPKAGTPGCTLQAAGFQQALPEFQRLGAQVIGVSTDTEAAQAKLRESCNLSFPLLPDGEKTVSRAYGVLGGLMGLFRLADRQTYLIDPRGRVVHHWRKVNPARHAMDVLRELQRRAAQPA